MVFIGVANAQNFSGQWKGEFYDKSSKFVGWGGEKCDYVLELECSGKIVKGFSYTYFTDEGKRYYTICRLEGFLDKKKKYIEIIELERTKTNVPVELNNCFQIHRLQYAKQDKNEVLQGTWIPAPNQQGTCGFGNTTLVRRALINSYPGYRAVNSRSPGKINKTQAQAAPPKPKVLVTSVAKQKPAPQKTASLKPNRDSLVALEKTDDPIIKNDIKITSPRPVYEKRNSNVLKTIELESATVKIDLYDNGEVDGDTISLFLNDKLLMPGKRLSTKPITLYLTTEELKEVNELVMYADNLGSIPPNTALMIVTNGRHRYEVRITSDLQKSGAIRFIKKIKKE